MTETEDRKAKAPEAGDLQVASRRALRKFGRGFRNTWKMYRESKTGLAGLAIVLFIYKDLLRVTCRGSAGRCRP